jgi:8-amino-3,8-dideoxy-alpha-D-manno-octulosonate transaminase
MYRVDEEEVEAVRRVILSKRFFRHSADGSGECETFEKSFAERLGVASAFLVSSGTNALVASLKSLNVGAGDEVLVPAYTFAATPAAVFLSGAKPVVVNVDDQLGISVKDAEKKITAKTKAVIAVHMDGLSASLGSILALAKTHSLFVVEDAAQALGGSYKDQALGSLGDAGAFSLNENKNISCGEGGIVVTKDPSLSVKQFLLQDFAGRYNVNKKKEFDFPEGFLGASMRVSEIHGALMNVQLKRLDGILNDLRRRKQELKKELTTVSSLKVLSGGCEKGDSASSLHLAFPNPLVALNAAQKLNEAGLLFYPPTLRPAHVAWKWQMDAALGLDKKDLAPSLHLLSCVLKYDLDLELSEEETRERGAKMACVLRGIL